MHMSLRGQPSPTMGPAWVSLVQLHTSMAAQDPTMQGSALPLQHHLAGGSQAAAEQGMMQERQLLRSWPPGSSCLPDILQPIGARPRLLGIWMPVACAQPQPLNGDRYASCVPGLLEA